MDGRLASHSRQKGPEVTAEARLRRRSPNRYERDLWQSLHRTARGVRLRRLYPLEGIWITFYAPRAKLAVETVRDHLSLAFLDSIRRHGIRLICIPLGPDLIPAVEEIQRQLCCLKTKTGPTEPQRSQKVGTPHQEPATGRYVE